MSDILVADRYRLLRTLGRGAVGEVWLADDLVLSRQVAVKRLIASSASGFDGEAIERIVREARVAARLHHPNIVSVFDLVTQDGQPYLVMEYVDGESLDARLRRSGPLSVEQARRLIGHVAEALAAAHERGIVHRDVKPANIMIDESGTAKLADFGIARGVGDATVTLNGQTVGTIAYMAPEVARGEEAAAPSDVWSLGITLFAATNGRAPYDDRSQSAIGLLMRIASEPVPDIPAGPLHDVVVRMLAPVPSERPSARDVARHLGVERSQSTDAQRATSADQSGASYDHRSIEITAERPAVGHPSGQRRVGRPRRWRLALLVGAIVAVVAAAAVLTVHAVSTKSPAAKPATGFTAAALAQTGDGASGAYSPDGRDEYLIAGSSLAVINPANGLLLRTIALDSGMNATQVIVASDGAVAYVTEIPISQDPFQETGSGQGAVLQVQLATKQIHRLPLCGNPVPRGMLLSADGQRLLVATDACNEVIDARTLTAIRTRTSPGAGSAPPPTILPDGRLGYVVEASGLVLSVDLSTGEFTGVNSVITGVRGALASPDGRYLYVYSPSGLGGDTSLRGELAVFDMSAKPLPKLVHGGVTLGFGAYAAAVSPDGRYIVALNSGYNAATHEQENGELTVVDTQDNFLSYAVAIAPGRGTMAFTADGKSVFVATVSGHVSKIDLATHTLVRSIDNAGPWLMRSPDPDVLYASDGRTTGVAIDVRTGQRLRSVSLTF